MTGPDRPAGDHPRRVAYVMSRFPKLTETFILNEIIELQRMGVEVDIHPLLRERQAVVHPDAERLAEGARFLPFLSLRILLDQLYYLRRAPRAYLATIWHVLAGTIRSPNFFVGALGILPKTVSMARSMQRDHVQHVHCHFATHPALAGLIIHRLTGIPFSFTAHGSDLHVDRTMLGQKVAEAAFVSTVSEFNADIIREEVAEADRAKVHVVHCGIDTEVFTPTGRFPANGTLAVVCVGTLHQVKGQRHLIEACAELRDRGVSVRARIIGDGADRERLARRVAELRLSDVVQLVGAVPTAAVQQELQHADVLVAPSVPTRGGKREGIPVVLMEAMASGLPVVASRLTGIPELVCHEGNGLLVAPGDVVDLADALQRLAEDPHLRARLGASGRQTIERDFSLATVTATRHRLMGSATAR